MSLAKFVESCRKLGGVFTLGKGATLKCIVVKTGYPSGEELERALEMVRECAREGISAEVTFGNKVFGFGYEFMAIGYDRELNEARMYAKVISEEVLPGEYVDWSKIDRAAISALQVLSNGLAISIEAEPVISPFGNRVASYAIASTRIDLEREYDPKKLEEIAIALVTSGSSVAEEIIEKIRV